VRFYTRIKTPKFLKQVLGLRARQVTKSISSFQADSTQPGVTAIVCALRNAMHDAKLPLGDLFACLDLKGAEQKISVVSMMQFARCFMWSIAREQTATATDASKQPSYNLLGRAVIQSSSLRQAMSFYAEYGVPQQPDFYNLVMEAQGDELYCGYQRDHVASHLPLDVLEIFDVIHLFWWKWMLSWCVDTVLPINEMRVWGYNPKLVPVYKILLNAPVNDGSDFNCFTFPRRCGDYAVARTFADFKHFARDPTAWLASLSASVRESHADQARALFGDVARGALPTLREAAQSLGCSPATLRRRLASEGVSFQALKDECRLAAASALLQETDLSIVDIASRLGFAGTAPFYTAFRRWTGTQPLALRKRA
jgi:AraC-like DNA-binding protein